MKPTPFLCRPPSNGPGPEYLPWGTDECNVEARRRLPSVWIDVVQACDECKCPQRTHSVANTTKQALQCQARSLPDGMVSLEVCNGLEKTEKKEGRREYR